MLITDRNQIVNAPTNNSTSKAQYSFQKAKRFLENSSSTSKFYDIPPSLNKRSTDFGRGGKYDFTSGKEKTPGPGTYEKVDPRVPHGFTFGLSRETCKGFVQGASKADPSIPGPGAYSFTPKFSNEGRKISLTGRGKNSLNKDEVPGPGAYNSTVSTSPGRYVVSNIKNLEVYSFSQKGTKFPKDNKNDCPAPGAYDVDKGFSGFNKVLSTCKSSGSIKFGNTERQFNYGIKNTPGPGSYRIPSEFGYYENPAKSQTASTQSLVIKRSNK
jgi:hypothetical protein